MNETRINMALEAKEKSAGRGIVNRKEVTCRHLAVIIDGLLSSFVNGEKLLFETDDPKNPVNLDNIHFEHPTVSEDVIGQEHALVKLILPHYGKEIWIKISEVPLPEAERSIASEDE